MTVAFYNQPLSGGRTTPEGIAGGERLERRSCLPSAAADDLIINAPLARSGAALTTMTARASSALGHPTGAGDAVRPRTSDLNLPSGCFGAGRAF